MNPEDWLLILGIPSILMVFGSMIYYVMAQRKMREEREGGGKICKQCGQNVGDGDVDGCRDPNCPEAK